MKLLVSTLRPYVLRADFADFGDWQVNYTDRGYLPFRKVDALRAGLRDHKVYDWSWLASFNNDYLESKR